MNKKYPKKSKFIGTDFSTCVVAQPRKEEDEMREKGYMRQRNDEDVEEVVCEVKTFIPPY